MRNVRPPRSDSPKVWDATARVPPNFACLVSFLFLGICANLCNLRIIIGLRESRIVHIAVAALIRVFDKQIQGLAASQK